MPKLIDRLIELALERHEAKQRLQIFEVDACFPLLFLFAAPPSTEDLESALKRFTECDCRSSRRKRPTR